MIDWVNKLINCLELETVDLDLLNSVDDLLSWIALRNDNSSYQALEQKYGEQVLNERFEEFLDRLIVGDLAAGEMFPLSLSEEHAKRRYRQLIRIFHPDRGAKSEVWLNYRAEKINKAHKYYLSNVVEFDVVASIDDVIVQPSVGQKTNQSPKGVFRYRGNIWRQRLGSPKEFQRKALSVLIIVSLLLVLIVFLGDGQSFDAGSDLTDISTELKKTNQSDVGLNPNKSSGEVYTLNSRAQKILQEADRIIAEDDHASTVGGSLNESNEFTSTADVVSFTHQGAEQESILSAIGSSKKAEKNALNCHALDGQSVHALNQDRILLRRLNMYHGPSLECNVLVELDSNTHLQLRAQTIDGKWTQITTSDGVLEGWFDTQLLMDSSGLKESKRIEARASIENKPLLVQVEVSPVIRVKSKNVEDVQIQSGHDVHGLLESSVGLEPVFFDVIEKLKLYYESGDDDAMAELYMSSGRENEIRGADKIRKYYSKAFNKTANRRFKYLIDGYEQDNESTAVLKGRMYLSLTPKKSVKVTNINADYKIVMVRVADNYKIAVFEWSRM